MQNQDRNGEQFDSTQADEESLSTQPDEEGLSTQPDEESISIAESTEDVTSISPSEDASTTVQRQSPLPDAQNQPFPPATPPIPIVPAVTTNSDPASSSQQAVTIATASTSAPAQTPSEEETKLMRAKAVGSGLGMLGGIMAGIGYFLPWFVLLVTVSSSCNGPPTYKNITVGPTTNPSCFDILMLLAALTLIFLSGLTWMRKSPHSPSMQLAPGFHLAASITGLINIPLQVFVMTVSTSIEEYRAGFWLALYGFITSLVGSIVIMATTRQLRALSRKTTTTAPANGEQPESAPVSQMPPVPNNAVLPVPMQRRQQVLALVNQAQPIPNSPIQPVAMQNQQTPAPASQTPVVPHSPAQPVVNLGQAPSLGMASCYRCRFPLPEGSSGCPRCGYPKEAQAEKQLLETVIADLKQLTMQDGAELRVGHLVRLSPATRKDLQWVSENLRIIDLIASHEARLEQLKQELAAEMRPAPQPAPVVLVPASTQSTTPVPPVAPPQKKEPIIVARQPGNAPVSQPVPAPAPQPIPAPRPNPAPPQVTPAPIRRTRPQVAFHSPQWLPSVPSVWSSSKRRFGMLAGSPLAMALILVTCIALIGILGISFIAGREFVTGHKRSLQWPAFGFTSLVLLLFFIVMMASWRSRRPHQFTHFYVFWRSHRLHEYAHIYTVCFALTIPVLAFDLEEIIQPGSIFLFVSMAFFIAAIAYGYLAIFEEFNLFGYASISTLTSADVTFFLSFPGGTGLQWVPASLVLLSLLSIIIMQRAGAPLPPPRFLPARFAANATKLGQQISSANWKVLKNPVRQAAWLYPCAIAAFFLPLAVILMLHIASGSHNLPGSALLMTISLNYPPGIMLSSHHHIVFAQTFWPFSIELSLLLLLLWFCRSIRASRRGNVRYAVPYLLLLCLLFLAYTLEYYIQSWQAPHIGYALALIVAATLFHGINRYRPRSLEPYIKAGLHLDTLAVILVGITPLLVASSVPTSLLSPGQSQLPSVNPLIVLVLVIGACLIASIAVNNATVSRTGGGTNQSNAWPWLLLVSSTLFIWAYGTVALWLHAILSWSLLLLALLATAVALLTRRKFGKSWSYPLDMVVISIAILTSISAQQQGQSTFFLLFFAALFYVVLCAQKRSVWLFVPFLLALLGLASSLTADRVTITLPAGLLLPFAAVIVHRLRPATPGAYSPTGATDEQLQVEWEWAWPLVLFAVICGILFIVSQPHPLPTWLWASFPPLELALFALIWYGCAWVVGIEWWLLPTGLFAALALLFSSSNLPVLIAAVPVTVLPGLAISRSAGKKVWVVPWYSSSLLSAVLAGIAGFVESQYATTAWLLLGFALLTICVRIVDKWQVARQGLWLFPVFTIWSAAAFIVLYTQPPHSLADFAALPVIALLTALIALAISRFDRQPTLESLTRRLPFYTAALASAGLTGIVGFTKARSTATWPGFTASVPLLSLVAWILLGFALLAVCVSLAEKWRAARQGLWLFPVFTIWSAAASIVLDTQTEFLHLPTIALLTALIALAISRFDRQPTPASVKWRLPFYSTALVSAVLAGVVGFVETQLFITAWLLLGFALLALCISVGERWRAALWGLWLFPIFTTWSGAASIVLYTQPPHSLADFAHLPVIALLTALAGLVLSRFDRRPALASFQWRLPFYTAALVSAVLMGIVGFTDPAHLLSLVAWLLLGFAALVVCVSFGDRWRAARWGAWLFPVFTTWSVAASIVLYAHMHSLTDLYHLPAVALLSAVLGLAIYQFDCHPTPGSVKWRLPIYSAAIIAAILTGLQPLLPPNTSFTIAIPVAGYSLLAFAAQLYLIGLVEQETDILWFVLAGVFSCSSLFFFVTETATTTLILLAVCGTAAGAGIRIVQRPRHQYQGQTDQHKKLRKYVLPFYSTALLALVLTGITCSLNTADPLHAFIPAILLIFAPIAFLVLMLEKYRVGMWLVAALGIWGILLLLLQTQVDTIAIAGVGLAAATGDTLYAIIRQRGQAAQARMWTWMLEQFSWRWPWYAIALTAFVIAGYKPSPALASVMPDFQLYSLVVFALVIYGAGMLQKQFVFLWTAPLFALWSLLIASSLLTASKHPDYNWGYLIAAVLCCVAVAILLSRLFCRVRIGMQSYWQTFLCYPLPFYVTAFAAALLTGFDGTLVSSIRQDIWMALLAYAVVSYIALRFEKRPALTALIAGFGIWGLLLALHTPTLTQHLVGNLGTGASIVGLLIGIVASIVGLLISSGRMPVGASHHP